MITQPKPSLLIMRLKLGGPLVQFLDQAVSIPVLLPDRDNKLCIAGWVGKPQTHLQFRARIKSTKRKDMKDIMTDIVNTPDSRIAADKIIEYWFDLGSTREMEWRTTLDEEELDELAEAYPPELTQAKKGMALSEIISQLQNRCD